MYFFYTVISKDKKNVNMKVVVYQLQSHTLSSMINSSGKFGVPKQIVYK